MAKILLFRTLANRGRKCPCGLDADSRVTKSRGELQWIDAIRVNDTVKIDVANITLFSELSLNFF